MRMQLPSRRDIDRHSLDGSQRKEGIAFQDRTLVAHHDDTTVALGLDLNQFGMVERVNDAEHGAFANLIPELGGRNKKTVLRSRMVDLQMGFLRIVRNAGYLGAQGGRRATSHSRPTQQIFEAAIQRSEINWGHSTRPTAFHIDRGDIAGKGRAQRATGQGGASPAPKFVKTGGHFALGFPDAILSDGIANPGKQFIRGSPAMQINIVGDLGHQLSVKQMRETGRGLSPGIAREGSGEVTAILWMAASGGIKGGFIQDRHHDNRATELGGSPLIGPLSQQGRSFIFIAMGGSIEQHYRPGTAAPDPGVKANLSCLETAPVEAGGEGAKIET